MAVNAAAAGWRPLSRKLTVFGSYVVLTEPVPELLEQISWTGGEAIFDGRMFLHYFRTTNDGRVLMGSGSGPIGFGGKLDAASPTTSRPSPARSTAFAICCPASPTRRSRTRGAGRSTSPPTTCRTSAPSPARASITAPATPATARARAGSAGRSWRASSWASTTSSRGCRSLRGGFRSCRPSRSAGSAEGSSAPRSSPARRPRSGEPAVPLAGAPVAALPRLLGTSHRSTAESPPNEGWAQTAQPRCDFNAAK